MQSIPLFPVTGVGSLPRSEAVLKAMRQKQKGKIDAAEFTADDEKIIQMLAAYAAAAIQNARLHENARRLAVLEERERIGMDLHDGIIQSIYAVGLALEYARVALDEDPKQSQQKIEQAIDGLNKTIRDIRTYILDLRPRHFVGLNLKEGLQRLVDEYRAALASRDRREHLDSHFIQRYVDERGYAQPVIPGFGWEKMFGVRERSVVPRPETKIRWTATSPEAAPSLQPSAAEFTGARFEERFEVLDATARPLATLDDVRFVADAYLVPIGLKILTAKRDALKGEPWPPPGNRSRASAYTPCSRPPPWAFCRRILSSCWCADTARFFSKAWCHRLRRCGNFGSFRPPSLFSDTRGSTSCGRASPM